MIETPGSLIKKYKNIKNNNKEIVKNYERFLIAGEYLSDPSGNIVFNKEQSKIKINTYTEDISNKSLIKFFDNLANKHRVNVEEDKKEFEGDTLVISSARNKVIIIDSRTKKLATFFLNEDEKINNIKNREKISKYYNIPKISKNEENYIIEDYLQKDDYDYETTAEFVLKKTKLILDDSDKHDLVFDYHKPVFGLKQMNINVTPKTCLCHKDMFRNNIIYTSNDFYLIDFDGVNEEYCLYDFFTLAFQEALLFGYHSFIANYFSGKYDEEITKILDVDSLNKETRREYFLIFIELFKRDRWSGIAHLHSRIYMYFYIRYLLIKYNK